VFRWVVPARWRDLTGQRELRLNLGTSERKQAIIFGMQLSVSIPELIAHLQKIERGELPLSSLGTEASGLLNLLQEKKKVMQLQEENERLECELLEAKRQLNSSVPRSIAETTARHAHQMGKNQGKEQIEKALAFPWPIERTPLFSELLNSYLASFDHRLTGTKDLSFPRNFVFQESR
jgi:hypothetical protein